MWMPDRTKLMKIRLHNQGEDAETVWAEDLGVAILHSAARYVRIGNIPILHAKPTYGDVIEVLTNGDGMLEWDSSINRERACDSSCTTRRSIRPED